jgi:hypothetical protein
MLTVTLFPLSQSSRFVLACIIRCSAPRYSASAVGEPVEISVAVLRLERRNDRLWAHR